MILFKYIPKKNQHLWQNIYKKHFCRNYLVDTCFNGNRFIYPSILKNGHLEAIIFYLIKNVNDITIIKKSDRVHPSANRYGK